MPSGENSVEQFLRDAGAQCVAGDLILDRKIVGQYRGGAFVATLEGIAIVEELQKAKQEEILAVAREHLAAEEPPRRGRRPRIQPTNYTAGEDLEVGGLDDK